jgi:putative sterol carrier protein
LQRNCSRATTSRGKLSPPVALATGKVRASGNLGKLMKMLPVLQSSEYQAVFKQMREITDY